ncbi:DUF6504 family protein [Frigoribacterium sp. 2-23]|uniref:DUF6504 family protein n=1 Tax=Frigoribacterium sp. 2-23 TaxID=3415006 RepID=UPI003C700669
MKIDEVVPVETTDEGSPMRFVWRGVVYGVVSSPERWVTRHDWWRSAARAPRGGTGAGLVEMPVWRVDALPLTDGAHRVDGTFDLAYDGVGGSWLLLGVFDDQIEQQLFA